MLIFQPSGGSLTSSHSISSVSSCAIPQTDTGPVTPQVYTLFPVFLFSCFFLFFSYFFLFSCFSCAIPQTDTGPVTPQVFYPHCLSQFVHSESQKRTLSISINRSIQSLAKVRNPWVLYFLQYNVYLLIESISHCDQSRKYR